MQNNYFIGIDGGGSKTRLKLEDEHGNLLAESVSGPGNVRLSIEVTCASIYDALEQALIKANLKSQKNIRLHIGMGLAGFEVQTAREEFLTAFHYSLCHTLEIHSDADIACFGAHGGKPGAVIIVGTGVVGLKIKKQQKFQVGGWGFPHGDEGGAAWIGLETIRALLQFCDGRAKKTPLLNYLKKKLGNKTEVINQWACYANATQYAEIARDVFYYAQKRDAFAMSILTCAAKHIEKIFLALEKTEKSNKNNLPYALVGGVVPFVIDFLSPSLVRRLVIPQGDSCDGALLMIKQQFKQS
jgi:glucosamine kinase